LNSSNRNKRNSICAIIPFYNEENFLQDVVKKTLNFVDLIIAVNDGSTDNSESLIKNLLGVQILSYEKNMGKGSALQNGFDESLKHHFDLMITLDGDGQHNPELIPSFVSSAKSYDIVIGNRLNSLEKMPLMRILSNKITSKLLSIKTKQNIIDSQCGFRLYKREVLEKVKTATNGFEAESEILILASRFGFKIGFTEIPTIYQNERSKMKPLSAIFGFIKVLLK
jgi:glycosyltransferase involved in cell wall biosynthesis